MPFSVSILKKLDDFTLNVKFETGQNDFMALLGVSGAGKTAVLRCIAGLDAPDRGRIVFNDRVLFDSEKKINLPPQKRRIGMIFQRSALFPAQTVRQNLITAAQGVSRKERDQAVDRRLRAFRLDAVADRYPRQLSPNQIRRASLARALLANPEALLLDEPFSALDSHLRWQAELELAEALRSFPGDALLASQDRGEVFRLCDSVCVLTEGHCEKKMSVQQLMTAPGTVSAALVSGCKNFSRVKRVDARHIRCLNWGMTLETAVDVPSVTTYVGVHAHSIHAAAGGEPNRFDARVARVIEDTNSTILMLAPEGGNTMLRMELSREEWAALRTPDVLLLSVAPAQIILLTGEL